jgi:hypothetical protein
LIRVELSSVLEHKKDVTLYLIEQVLGGLRSKNTIGADKIALSYKIRSGAQRQQLRKQSNNKKDKHIIFQGSISVLMKVFVSLYRK